VKTPIATLAALAIATAALLTACTPATTYSVPADDIATTAEDALEEQVGSRPEIDCGAEDVVLAKNKIVDCVLTDPASGERFEAPITIEDTEGTDYTIGIQVGDAPID
jgi:hypothetical protein